MGISKTLIVAVTHMNFGTLLLMLCCVQNAWGQYETPNDLCGGWFRQTNGSIVFDMESRPPSLECIWTVSPMLPRQSDRFSLTLKSHDECPDGSITINHFNLRSTSVTHSETWNCNDNSDYTYSADGTIFAIVYQGGTNGSSPANFSVSWQAEESKPNSGLRTMYYSWGKPTIEPLPYFASSMQNNAIASYAFPRGNDTADNHVFQVSFHNIKLNQCNSTIDDDCENQKSSFLVAKIEDGGEMSVISVYEDEITEFPEPVSSKWGFFFLAWLGDFWGSGGSFQMYYTTGEP